MFLNELRFVLYNYEYMFFSAFSSFLFSAGFLISTLLVAFGYLALFRPAYLLKDKKGLCLAPLSLAVFLQFIMLAFNRSDLTLRAFFIQDPLAKFLFIKHFVLTYGSFFGCLFLLGALMQSYNSRFNQMVRPFEFDLKTLNDEAV